LCGDFVREGAGWRQYPCTALARALQIIVCRANAGARELLLDIIFTTLIIKLPGLCCARGAISLLYLATLDTYSEKEAKHSRVSSAQAQCKLSEACKQLKDGRKRNGWRRTNVLRRGGTTCGWGPCGQNSAKESREIISAASRASASRNCARCFGLRSINSEPVTVDHHPQPNDMFKFLPRTSPPVPSPDLEPLRFLNKLVCVQ
jgi:hypothetical protein